MRRVCRATGLALAAGMIAGMSFSPLRIVDRFTAPANAELADHRHLSSIAVCYLLTIGVCLGQTYSGSPVCAVVEARIRKSKQYSSCLIADASRSVKLRVRNS